MMVEFTFRSRQAVRVFSAAAVILGSTATVSAQSLSEWETAEYFRSGGLAQINAAAAYALGYTGKGVVVGVADSGLDARLLEFAGRILPGYDFSARVPLLPGEFRDPVGHGTHVAGIIAAARDGVGMHGVAFNSSVIATRIGDNGVFGLDEYFTRAWVYLIDSKVPIISGSYGISGCQNSYDSNCTVSEFSRENIEEEYPKLLERSRAAVSADVLMVLATGNASQSSPDPLAGLPYLYPELKDNWLAVAAVNAQNQIWDDSNRCGVAMNWCVVAPGVGIYSTAPLASTGEARYQNMSGTSQATPFVSGVAALVKEAFPWFTAHDLQQTILTTATDLGAPGVDEVYGWGLVNAGKAVRGYGMFTSMVTLDTQGYTSTFSNDISGAGGFVKTGAGTLILTGNNSYSGGTTLAQGMLVLGSSRAAGTGSIGLGDGTALGFVNGITVANPLVVSGNVNFDLVSGTATASGPLSGAGAIAFTGDGLINLTGDNSAFTGVSAVDATVVVNGTLGGSVTVLGGGSLEGSGTVGATSVGTGGAIAPGSGVGTLTVNGALTLAPGATYEADLRPASGSDLLLVNGTATLDGATVAGTLQPGTYTPGARYTILTATEGVTGTFGQVIESLPFLDLLLSYDANSVSLDIVRNGVPFRSAAASANQFAAAGALDALPDGNVLGDAVMSQASVSGAQQAFNAVSGELYASTLSALQSESLILRRAVLDRARVPVLQVATPALGYAASGAQGEEVAVPGSSKAFWAQAYGAWSQIDGTTNSATMSGDVAGIVVGYDRTLSGAGADWRLGFAMGYSSSGYQVDARASSISSDAAQIALYGGASFGALGLRFGGAYSWADLSGNRSVVFPGFSDALNSDTSGSTGQVFGEVGYATRWSGVDLEPFAGIAYVNTSLGGFSEVGGPAALSVSNASAGVTYSTLGLRLSVPLALGTVEARVRGTLGWQHAIGDTTPRATMAFGPGAPSFTVSGVPIATDAALMEAGLDVAFTPAASLSVFYAGQLAQSETSNMVKGSFTLKF